MDQAMDAFISYLYISKETSENTRLAYYRDLCKLKIFMEEHRISRIEDVGREDLANFVKELEKRNFKAATVSRCIASVKAFYHFLYRERMVSQDLGQDLHAPKIEKKRPVTMTAEEMSRLSSQPSGNSPKQLRDRAMLSLLCATGMRVTELISLRLSDVNFQSGHVLCRDDRVRKRMISFGQETCGVLLRYVECGRSELVGERAEEALFVNCSGGPMSRQGFWKLLKHYAQKAGLEEITPHTIRHSFAVQLVSEGVDLKTVQEVMGHSDIATTQVYVEMSRSGLKERKR